MYEMSKLCYRVSEADVVRARNQVTTSYSLKFPLIVASYVVLIYLSCDIRQSICFTAVEIFFASPHGRNQSCC